MKWILKAQVQNAISLLPKAEKWNYLLQRHVTRNVPFDDRTFCRKVEIAAEHLERFRTHCPSLKIEQALFYEFGAGWELIGALTYYLLGADCQILTDIRPNVRLWLVNNTLERLAAQRAELEQRIGRAFRDFDASPIESIEELEDRFGITYLAPHDAADTKFAPESIDFITTTVTLQNIPEPDVARILAECRRVLRPGGVMSSLVDLKDQYSLFDPSITPYNYLKFSPRAWRLFNCSLHYQNRLRHPDYIRLFRDAGFAVVEQRLHAASPEELDRLSRMKLADQFRGKYSLEDLSAKMLAVAVVKPAGPGRAP